jgi:NADH:ubiquinone reductase (non-electrogenic)
VLSVNFFNPNSGELHDFLEVLTPLLSISHDLTLPIQDDLKSWYPELAGKIRITLVEALPSVLPMFSKQLIDYTQSTFKQSKIEIMTKTMVKEIKDQSLVLQMPDKSIVDVPCGMVVWAAVDIFLLCKNLWWLTIWKGNTGRPLTRNLMAKLADTQTNKRGITVDGTFLLVSNDLFQLSIVPQS